MIELPKITVELVNSQPATTPGVWDFIKDYIYPLLPTLLGSGIFGYVFWKRRRKEEERIKAEVQKEVEAYKAELQTTANVLSQTLSEKITRRSKAFELSLKKEYEFYEKYSQYVPIIINANATASQHLCLAEEQTITIQEAENGISEYDALTNKFDYFRFEYNQYIDVKISNECDELVRTMHFYYSKLKDILSSIENDTCEIDISRTLAEESLGIYGKVLSIGNLISYIMNIAKGN